MVHVAAAGICGSDRELLDGTRPVRFAAYPVVHLINGEPVQALDIGTKVIEAVGLLAALRARDDDELGFAPLTVIAGVFLALLMVSVTGGHHHAHDGGAGAAHHHH